jgi:hypothetical protein
MKKIFIVGCSYTNWNDGDCFGESYPALIAKEYPNWHVYDASEPGGSNDSVYLRLRYLEKLYGAPDKIIVQWTHLPRTTVVTDEFIPRDFKHNTVENYTYCEQSVNYKNFPSVTITRQMLFKKTIKRRRRQQQILINDTGLSLKHLSIFYAWFLNSQTLFWNTQKEIDLVNAVYGKDNVLMYDWHNQYSPGSMLTISDNWIGSLAYAFRKKNKFMSLGIDDAPHYAAEGHLEVYKWLMPHLNKLLT